MPPFAGDEAAMMARTAWYGLSRALHHHTYELAPTVAELLGWHQDVTTLLNQLRAKLPVSARMTGLSPYERTRQLHRWGW
jgi:hypothetical protein